MKKIIAILFACVLPFLNVKAEENWNELFNDTYGSSESIDVTTVQNDNEEGSKFQAGLTIEDEEIVDGISGIAGQTVTTSGSSEYGLYAGLTVNVKSNIEKELFAAGETIKVNANIGRDAYIAGSEIEVKGTIGRNAYIAGEIITFENVTINGNLKLYATQITFGENVIVNGEIKYNDNTIVTGLNELNNKNVTTYHVDEEETTTSFGDTIIDTLISFIALLIVAYVLNAIFPKLYKNINKEVEFNKLPRKALLGLAILLIIPVLSVIVLFTGIGTPLSLIVLAIYAILCYISKLIILSIVGNNIYTIYLKKKDKSYVSILIGCAIYYIITLIPVIGGLIEFLILILGLGYAIQMISEKRSK